MLEQIDAREQLTPVHITRPRAVASTADAERTVRGIVDDVQLRGDVAILEYTERFDRARLTAEQLRVPPEVVARSRSLVRPELIDALEVMAERLRTTSMRQLPESWIEQADDHFIGEVVRPLHRVGIYAPGGHATYPSSVIMAAVPAQAVGVEGIAVASPPGADGEMSEAVLAACAVAGIDEVYRIGGAQAIAAFAFGSASVRPVDKIVGPGNVYVTLAKRFVQGRVGIDTEAGPTEIAIVADETAEPDVVAADLIAQAEHGPHGSHILISWVPELVNAVGSQLELQLARHERSDDVENALIEGGVAVLVRDLRQAMETANFFAPEHLQLMFAGARDALDTVHNAGSVFIGAWSPVPIGDYVGGTNHVLPTGGSARWASGLGAADFVTRTYVSGFEREALERLAPHVDALAEAEGLPGHARAVRLRLRGEAG